MANVIDHSEGTYSDIDVDAVDYVKYPMLANINYGVVEMKQGDCLFIPYKWLVFNFARPTVMTNFISKFIAKCFVQNVEFYPN